MDPCISWYLPEQEGPAKHLWYRIWQTQQEMDNMNLKEGDCELESITNGFNTHNNAAMNGKTDKSANYANRRRKDNRPTTRIIRRTPPDYGGCPWRINKYPYLKGVLGLHQEIEHFYQYMSPTEAEDQIRAEVVGRIEKLLFQNGVKQKLKFLVPTVQASTYPPENGQNLPLRTLEQEFLEKDIAVENSIKVLDKASVPIVKLTDKKTDIKVDISFNMCNGVKSAELIKTYVDRFPVLPKLVYVLKQFLLDRDLNEVFTGGISSYSLILMCISFLQLHPRQDSLRNSSANLGVLLIEFFELYGRKFNYINTGIRIRDGGKYINKEEMQKEMIDGHRPSMLCIEDPLQPSNDIGRSSYGVLQVKRAFEYAYSVLCSVIHPLSTFNSCMNHSILGRIVRVRDKVVQQRRLVQDAVGNRTRPSTRSSSTGSTSSAEESGGSSEASDVPSRDDSPNISNRDMYAPHQRHSSQKGGGGGGTMTWRNKGRFRHIHHQNHNGGGGNNGGHSNNNYNQSGTSKRKKPMKQ